MSRLRIPSVIAAILLISATSASLAAGTGRYDGEWTVSLKAPRSDVETCQFRRLKGNVTISGDRVRLSLPQRGITREFRGSIDRYGYFDAAGDWERRRGDRTVLETHFLNGRIRGKRIRGAFYSFGRLGGRSCFARFVIDDRRPHSQAVDTAATLAAGISDYDGNWFATLRAEGVNISTCQFRELRGDVTISGDDVRVSLRQGGNTREFRGKVTPDGEFEAAGEWANSLNGGGGLQTHLLKGRFEHRRFEDRRFVGEFYSDPGTRAAGRGRSCFANFVIADRWLPSQAVASADASPAIDAAGPPRSFSDAQVTETAPEAEESVMATEQTTGRTPTDAVDDDGDGAWVTDAAGPPQVLPGTRAAGIAPVAGEAASGAGETVATAERIAEHASTAITPPERGDPAATGETGSPEGSPEGSMERARRMVAEGPISEVVAYVNGPGDLSPVEQWALFSELEGPEIVDKLKTGEDTTARKIGRILETVANGAAIDQPQMKSELTTLGINGRAVLTYLAMFERARKHARTEMYGAALTELRHIPQVTSVTVRPPAERSPAITGEARGEARKVALLIGVETYRDPIPDLRTPITDVEAIGRQLRNRFGYDTRILRNATKAKIVAALQDLVNTLGEEDSAIIMYAGHGYILESTGDGYWLPADATTNTAKQWMSNKDIANFLKAIPAKRIMLIADSCYSGSLLSGRNGYDGVRITLKGGDLDDKRSVMIMTSGGEEPVGDGGGEGHSVFAQQLMTTLEAVERYRPGAKIYRGVRTRIAKLAPQVPRYGGVIAAGHQAGTDYVFHVAADAGTLVAEGNTVVADAGPVVADRGPVVADTGAVDTDGGAVVADRGPVVADTDPVVADTGAVDADGGAVVADTDTVLADTDTVVAGTDTAAVTTDGLSPATQRPPPAVTVANRSGLKTKLEPSAASHEIIVKPGESLWRIARRTYGRGSQNMRIFESNRDRIHIADLIYPGQRLSLPRIAGGGAEPAARPRATPQITASPAPADPSHRVVVRPGDSLWRIARRVYGRGTLNMEIFQVNRDRIRAPDLIHPGRQLILPKIDARGRLPTSASR